MSLELVDDLYRTFQKYNQQRRDQLLKIFSNVRCCECGHQLRMERAQKKATTSPSCTIVFLIAMLLIIVYLIHLARRYNRALAFGSCACVSTFFYTVDDCEVAV